jgi:fluoroacetyl-CoA thioesterase
MEMKVGASARIEYTVTDADTASALGSGDVPVLGTPKLVALAEQATVAALSGRLADGNTSVGTRIDLTHIAATPVGRAVVAEATLAELDGRRVTFDVTVSQGETVLARGHIYRAIVDRAKFLLRVAEDT